MGCLDVESVITVEGSLTGTVLIIHSSYSTERVLSKLSGLLSPLTTVGRRETLVVVRVLGT